MDDELWALVEPSLPPWPERSPGPRPVSDRLCLQGILFVLHNDIAWQLLPLELGFGSRPRAGDRPKGPRPAGIPGPAEEVGGGASPARSETMIRWAMIGIMVRRLTRTGPAARPGPRPLTRVSAAGHATGW
ncbi:transposase [Streptomyces durocortorensis]|uniref:Transposase n=1 Tax=Streptomyces durocortorensis TaxID=2811104 RepID=A0ABS2I6W6_9ACTN|nr:transposase [Streptomyces durocortorensis]